MQRIIQCSECGGHVAATGNKQYYCPDCSIVVRRRQGAVSRAKRLLDPPREAKVRRQQVAAHKRRRAERKQQGLCACGRDIDRHPMTGKKYYSCLKCRIRAAAFMRKANAKLRAQAA